MVALDEAAARCASHPALLAVDACPVCGRHRCAAEAARLATTGCAVCRETTPAVSVRPPREAIARAVAAAMLTAFPGGWVASEYVNIRFMSLVWPAVLGLGVSWAGSAFAGRRTRPVQRWVLAATSVVAVLATALGFRLFGRPVTPLHPAHQVWLPYVAAAVGAVGWPLLFGYPRAPDGQPAVGTD